MLEEFLAALREIDAAENVFSVGGDPAVPHGPYEDSLSLIESGVFQRYGVRHVSIARPPGRPPGGPDRRALVGAREQVRRAGEAADPGRGAHPGRVRRGPGARLAGGGAPARGGTPGPGRRARARPASRGCSGSPPRLGVSTSATIAKKYGFSMTNLLGKAGPDKFIRELQDGLRPGQARRGEAALLHVRRLQVDRRVDRQLPPGVLARSCEFAWPSICGPS